MPRYGYARVSSANQDYATQEARLKAGVYKGGKPRIDHEVVHSLHRDGKGPTEIAKALGISRMHAYRLIKAMEPVA